MFLPPSAVLLDRTLRTVARRYRLPEIGDTAAASPQRSLAEQLALAIEWTRRAIAQGGAPEERARQHFLATLARMIEEAMQPDRGDPAFQAMVLRQREGNVREYASLAAGAGQDQRRVHADLNAIAHPNRPQTALTAGQRQALAPLQAAASASSWSALDQLARHARTMPDIANDAAIDRALARLLENPALERLRRLETLSSDARVIQYRSLWERQGPRQGSAAAAAQGSTAQQRGAAAEALATQALEGLAQQLNRADNDPDAYRVVTSLRVPASIPASHERAKTEWDVVLVRKRAASDEIPVHDIVLLVEVKASADAATTDFPKLLRGLRLLSHARPDRVYAFETRQGEVLLHGAALGALGTAPSRLASTLLYCCDAPPETHPRLLNAASRMQLLSADASLAYACRLAAGLPASPRELEPLWQQLLESPRWRAVLDQYATLRQVRALMVHTADLLEAVHGIGRQGR